MPPLTSSYLGLEYTDRTSVTEYPYSQRLEDDRVDRASKDAVDSWARSTDSRLSSVSGSYTGTFVVRDGNLVQDSSGRPETFGPEHHFYGRSGRWLAGIDVANVLKSRDFVPVARMFTFAFEDGATTSGSATLTSVSQGGFAASMVGAALSGSGIPDGTTVASVAGSGSLTMSAVASATATGVRVLVTQDGVQDEMYVRHRGRLASTFGFGVTPPAGTFRVQVAASDSEDALGGLAVRVGPSQTGPALVVHDSNGAVAGAKWTFTRDFYQQGPPAGYGVGVRAETTNGRALTIQTSDTSASYTWDFTSNSSRYRYVNGAVTFLQFEVDGSFRHMSSRLGFYSAAGSTKPTVTGSRVSGEALANLLMALHTLGLVANSSSA